MKIRITDLMDYYRGEPVNVDLPAACSETSAPQGAKAWPQRRMQRPLLIAASLILAVTAGIALPLTLSRTAGGNALNDGAASVERVLETLPPELPAIGAESTLETAMDSSVEDPQETPGGSAQAPSDLSAYLVSGQMTWEENRRCYGNLFCVGGSYYTMGKSGPEPIQLQNLNTTVELSGTWELNIDYAVIDGELAFRDLNPADDASRPHVATAYPVKGSTDTVMLMVARNLTKSYNMGEPYDYKFLYNIQTGEVTDPLSKVTELYDHGNVTAVLFNDDFSRAIVDVETESQVPEDFITAGWGDRRSYLCDLTTGEMTPVSELAAPHYAAAGLSEDAMSENGCCYFADRDTVLLYEMQTISTGPEDFPRYRYETRGWLFALNADTGACRYTRNDGILYPNRADGDDFSVPYFHDSIYDGSAYRILDSSTGTAYYTLQGESGCLLGMTWDDEGSRRIWTASGGSMESFTAKGLYLVDDAQKGIVKISDQMDVVPEDIQTVKMVTEDWFCLGTEGQVYCYHIPENLSMTPWTAE